MTEYIVEEGSWQEACNGIACCECSMLDGDACRIGEYIQKQPIYVEAELDTTKEDSDRPHGEWIPCSERLPDKLGDYLVTDIRGNVYCSTLDYVLKEKYFGYDDDGYFVKDDTVVAWMPLPKPYKKEGEAE